MPTIITNVIFGSALVGAALKSTRYYRDHNGWCGESSIALPGHADRMLMISSHKHSDGTLVSSASVRTKERDGMWSFVIGGGKDGDFYKVVARSAPKRVTERVVREQHNRVLVDFDAIVQEACQHYAAQEQRKEANELQQTLAQVNACFGRTAEALAA